MKHRFLYGLLVLALSLLVGCESLTGYSKPQLAPHSATEQEEAFDAQLGLLRGELTVAEQQACMDIWSDLWPIRRDRLARNGWPAGEYEGRLARRLRKLLDEYTIQYLDGDVDGFGYENPPYQDLAQFHISEGEDLNPRTEIVGEWDKASTGILWDEIRAILPAGSFESFSRFELFTDGPEETLAYVSPSDATGTRWILAVDPADAGMSDLFTETILHEYFHYMSLNNTQMVFSLKTPSGETYAESGMSARSDSYLNQFYQRFWAQYIDDCLAGTDSYNFFLRHDNDFISPYASTDPSEDICESFTYFVLYDGGNAQEIWEQKLNFFYDYPELVELRTQIRENLDLA